MAPLCAHVRSAHVPSCPKLPIKLTQEYLCRLKAAVNILHAHVAPHLAREPRSHGTNRVTQQHELRRQQAILHAFALLAMDSVLFSIPYRTCMTDAAPA